MSSAVIEFTDVGFSYKSQNVFNKLSFAVTGDQMIGVVGVNGSGKSTLMRMILGLAKAQSGDIKVLDHAPGHFKNRPMIGSSLQDIDFPATERVEEIVHFVSQQFESKADTEELIKDFDLTDFRRKACGQLSGGMKRRLSLACAFAGNPSVVLLDEPTTGLDRNSRNKLLENLRKYQDRNHALILMISHHPEEVMDSVDQFLHVKDSNVQYISPEKMKEMTRIRKVEFNCENKLEYANALKSEYTDKRQSLIVKDSDQFVKDLCQMEFPFENLQIQKLAADELIGEIL